MPTKTASLTRSQESTIRQLLRRGEQISRIAQIVGVNRTDVEKVLEKTMERELAW